MMRGRCGGSSIALVPYFFRDAASFYYPAVANDTTYRRQRNFKNGLGAFEQYIVEEFGVLNLACER